MAIELNPNEEIIKEGFANLQKGIETIGGKLHLTNQRIVFIGHKINVQGGATELSLDKVKSADKCWTKFLGKIPITPNSLAVSTDSGEEYRFALFFRGSWKTAIETAKNA
jgi:hypothetical protein